jgi:hypothetical protein
MPTDRGSGSPRNKDAHPRLDELVGGEGRWSRHSECAAGPVASSCGAVLDGNPRA